MLLLALTDLHLAANKPAGRLGDYVADVEAKLDEIVYLAHKYNVAAVICAGDIFHRPAPAYSVLVRFQAFLERLNRRFIAIPGSHDLFGNNLDALHRTAIGFLDRVYVRFELLYEPFNATRVANMSIGNAASSVLDVEMVHGSVLPKPDFGEFTLLQDYKTAAKLVFVGHYHDGYDQATVNGTTFLCPGSLVRTSAKASELTRRPRVALISDSYQVTWIELESARPGEEVLSPPIAVPQIIFDKLSESWAIDSIEDVDIVALLKQVGKDANLSNSMLQYALRYLEEQRVKLNS